MASLRPMSDVGTRSRAAPARPPGPPPRRSRPLQLTVLAACVALVGVAAFFLLRGDDGDERPASPRRTESASTTLEYQPDTIESQNGGPPVQLTQEQVDAIMATAASYVDDGLIKPLRTGKVPDTVAGLFDAGAAATLAGPNRAALFDEGLPKATGDIDGKSPIVRVVGLSDQTGTFVLSVVGFQLDITAETDAGKLTINRSTFLTLVPEATQWKITAYDVVVNRSGPGVAAPQRQATATTGGAGQ